MNLHRKSQPFWSLSSSFCTDSAADFKLPSPAFQARLFSLLERRLLTRANHSHPVVTARKKREISYVLTYLNQNDDKVRETQKMALSTSRRHARGLLSMFSSHCEE